MALPKLTLLGAVSVRGADRGVVVLAALVAAAAAGAVALAVAVCWEAVEAAPFEICSDVFEPIIQMVVEVLASAVVVAAWEAVAEALVAEVEVLEVAVEVAAAAGAAAAWEVVVLTTHLRMAAVPLVSLGSVPAEAASADTVPRFTVRRLPIRLLRIQSRFNRRQFTTKVFHSRRSMLLPGFQHHRWTEFH